MNQLKPEHQAILDDPDHKFNKLQKKYSLLVERLKKQEIKMNELLDMVEYLEHKKEILENENDNLRNEILISRL